MSDGIDLIIDGRQRIVTGRAAAIVRAIASCAGHINAIDVGSFRADFNGRRIVPSVVRSLPPIKVDLELPLDQGPREY